MIILQLLLLLILERPEKLFFALCEPHTIKAEAFIRILSRSPTHAQTKQQVEVKHTNTDIMTYLLLQLQLRALKKKCFYNSKKQK
jgi:hypothetical protein